MSQVKALQTPGMAVYSQHEYHARQCFHGLPCNSASGSVIADNTWQEAMYCAQCSSELWQSLSSASFVNSDEWKRNTLNALQVSKSLLDTAMKAPKRPKAPSPAPQDVASPDVIADLLQFREDSLTGQIGMSMARAMKGAGPSGVLSAHLFKDTVVDNLVDVAFVLLLHGHRDNPVDAVVAVFATAKCC